MTVLLQRRPVLLESRTRPTWYWDFRRNLLPPDATFSRASGALVVASDGVLKWAPENLVARSQEFDNAVWTRNASGTGSSPVVTANDAAAPDGTMTADKVVFDAGAGVSPNDWARLYSPDFTGTAGQSYAGGLYIKGTAGAQLMLRHAAGSNYQLVTLTGGWDLLVHSETAVTTNTRNLEIAIRQGLVGTINSTATVWLWGARVYRMPNVSTGYIATTSKVHYGPRFDYDPVTLQPLGYLAEMQSTNGLTHSQEFDNAAWFKVNGTVTADTTVAPDGTLSADTFTEDGSNGVHGFQRQPGLNANTSCGVSLFFKAGTRSKCYLAIGGILANDYVSAVFDTVTGTVSETKIGSVSGTLNSAEIRNCGGGWYRCAIVGRVTSAAGYMLFGLAAVETGNTFNGNGEVTYAGDNASSGTFWGAQKDTDGVGVTSYIPTSDVAVTRSQDVLSIALDSLPGWSPSQGGVVSAAYRLHTIATNNNQLSFQLDDAGANNRIAAYPAGTGQRYQYLMVSAGNLQFDISSLGAVPTPFQHYKAAMGWGAGVRQLAVDNSVLNTGANSFTLPTLTTLNLGRGSIGGLNGSIESIAYYRGARPDALVQAISK